MTVVIIYILFYNVALVFFFSLGNRYVSEDIFELLQFQVLFDCNFMKVLSQDLLFKLF